MMSWNSRKYWLKVLIAFRQEKLVISLYYYDDLSIKEIGHVLGVSESRVSQIHSKALMKLRGKIDWMK